MAKKDPSQIQSATDAQMGQTDAIVVIDKSGSMGDASIRFPTKSKWEELREDVSAIAREFAKYDADGLTVIPFSSDASTIDGVKPETVSQLFAEHSPRGSTNLAAALQEALKKAQASQKQAVVLVFTDGSPDDTKAATAIVEQAGKELGRPRIGFVFVQVGNDRGAAEFLDHLDSNLAVDVCATVAAQDAENLSVEQLVWLAQNG